jgi:tRNA (guanosine-2'-O-)-methyltransferase
MSAELVKYLSGFVNEQKLEKFDRILEFRTRYINIVCEDIYQGHNANAIIRTCDCFGIQDIHVIEKRNCFEINSEIALGATNWISIYRYGSLQNNKSSVYKDLRSRGYRILATTPHRNGIRLQDVNLDQGPVSIVFGTEKEGLSSTALEEADGYLSIDMFGFTESLNVSVSAGIILHGLRLKLSESDIDWHLTDYEKLMIKLDWLRRTIKRSDLLEKKFLNNNGGQERSGV